MLRFKSFKINKNRLIEKGINGYNAHLLNIINILFLCQIFFDQIQLKNFVKPGHLFLELVMLDWFIFEYISDFYFFRKQLFSNMQKK